MQALQQGTQKIAVLTDQTNTPGAIAHLLLALDLTNCYQFWVCENLGGRRSAFNRGLLKRYCRKLCTAEWSYSANLTQRLITAGFNGSAPAGLTRPVVSQFQRSP